MSEFNIIFDEDTGESIAAVGNAPRIGDEVAFEREDEYYERIVTRVVHEIRYGHAVVWVYAKPKPQQSV